MANAPESHELHMLGDGIEKVVENKDVMIPNAATYHLEKEDHTLGNILRMQLLKDKTVLFAGYKMAHPLDHSVDLKVQTTQDTTPLHALQCNINSLQKEIAQIKLTFKVGKTVL